MSSQVTSQSAPAGFGSKYGSAFRCQMRSVERHSISDQYETRDGDPIPMLTPGGARIRVCFAGACYTEGQIINSGHKRPKMRGVHDTSLFPGYEVSGVIDTICPTVLNSDLKEGDRVIVHTSDDQERAEYGYSEFIIVKDLRNLIKLPDSLPLDVAATLPSGALTAFSAVQRVKPFVEQRIHDDPNAIVNVLIVGAGGLGLWTLRLAEFYIGTNCANVRLAVADSSIEKLLVAKEHGCYDVIHWDDALHEEYILMRIKNVCKGGVDVCIDFVSSARTVNRATKVLKEEGVLIVGGNSKFEVPICLHSLAVRRQSILGIHNGTREQLAELVECVASGQIKPPVFSVYPVEDANMVFNQLSQCKISGRAVFKLTPADYESSVFYPDNASQDRLRNNSQSEEEDVYNNRSNGSNDSLHNGNHSPTSDSLPTPAEGAPVRFGLF